MQSTSFQVELPWLFDLDWTLNGQSITPEQTLVELTEAEDETFIGRLVQLFK